MADVNREQRILMRKAMLAEQVTISRDKDVDPSVRTTAARQARALLLEIEAEEDALRREEDARVKEEARSKAIADAQLNRPDVTTMNRRRFLELQIEETELDLQTARAINSTQASAAHRRQLMALYQSLQDLDDQDKERDPYADLTPEEAAERLRDEALPDLDDRVLLACIREYVTRHRARCTLTHLEGGGMVELTPEGWQRLATS